LCRASGGGALMDAAVPYAGLTPDVVLAAIESAGTECDGSILALNSYENRVYQVGTYDGFVVAKFYRPNRWDDAAILEEHAFSLELVEHEIPVVPPRVVDGRSLHEHAGYRFAVFDRRGGRWPELGSEDERVWMGRFLGRIHAVGAVRPFVARPTLSIEHLGHRSVEDLLDSDWIPPHLTDSYEAIAYDLLDTIERIFDETGSMRTIRIHGDCHPGNVLWTDDGPHFVDLDDCMNGPAVQDLWLFLSGAREEMAVQMADLLEGYEQFAAFDYRELRLVEALRALRMLRYTAWIARRWQDPAFPMAFPWFAELKYWEEQVLSLREQRAALDEPVLSLAL
jgi:Ser/Thr protein kinase RdoA (MazF antagonist)